MKTTLTALGTLGICAALRHCLDRPDRSARTCAGGHIRLTALHNEQGAFSLPLSRELLLSLSGAALGTLWSQRRHLCPWGTGLILGGGLSNLLERARQGKVYDYLQFPRAPRPLNRYVYNLADLAILLGGICILLGRPKK